MRPRFIVKSSAKRQAIIIAQGLLPFYALF
jgi:hypothetical protein